MAKCGCTVVGVWLQCGSTMYLSRREVGNAGEFAGRVFSLQKGGFNPGSVIHLVSKAAKDDSVLGD